MKTFISWVPPVAVSLLLHTAVIVLATWKLASNTHHKNTIQTITVELLGQTSTVENRIRKQDTPPEKKPVVEPVTPQAVTTSLAEDLPAPPAPAIPEQATNPIPEARQTGLNVQPLSKLSRPPAFLRKIDPVYPSSEQRSGSQAYVLAEVTIDAKGNVVEVRIAKSAGVHFDNAVREALQASVFVPGYIDKDAVAVRVLVPFRFNLR